MDSHLLVNYFPARERGHLMKARPDTFVFAAIGGSADGQGEKF